jgi:hypothetical protein
MEEYKNWAAFNGIRDKFDPIQKKVVGDETAKRHLMTKRLDVRRILGSKFGQELIQNGLSGPYRSCPVMRSKLQLASE